MFQTFMTLLWNTKEDVLKNASKPSVSVPLYIDFYYIFMTLQHWERNQKWLPKFKISIP